MGCWFLVGSWCHRTLHLTSAPVAARALAVVADKSRLATPAPAAVTPPKPAHARYTSNKTRRASRRASTAEGIQPGPTSPPVAAGSAATAVAAAAGASVASTAAANSFSAGAAKAAASGAAARLAALEQVGTIASHHRSPGYASLTFPCCLCGCGLAVAELCGRHPHVTQAARLLQATGRGISEERAAGVRTQARP